MWIIRNFILVSHVTYLFIYVPIRLNDVLFEGEIVAVKWKRAVIHSLMLDAFN